MKKNKKAGIYPSGVKSGWIIGVASVIAFLLTCYPYLGTDLFRYTLLFAAVDFCLLVFVTMIVPVLAGIVCERLTPKGVKILCAVNSLVVCGAAVVLSVCGVTGNPLIGVLFAVSFYLVNTHCLLQMKKRELPKKKAFAIVGIGFAVWIAVLVICLLVYRQVFPSIVLAEW